jgi:hypothetical protein
MATFPSMGEWEYLAPYSLTNHDFALVLDIQQTNSTSNVASLTSIVGKCGITNYDQYGDPIRLLQPYTEVVSAADTINRTDITVTASIAY